MCGLIGLGEAKVGATLSVGLAPYERASPVMTNLELRTVALCVVRATDEARALCALSSIVAEHEYTLAIRLTACRRAGACIASVKEWALFIGLTRVGAFIVDASRPFVETVAVFATLGAALTNAERCSERRALVVVAAVWSHIQAEFIVADSIAFTEGAKCFTVIRIGLAGGLVKRAVGIGNEVDTAVWIHRALHPVALSAGDAQVTSSWNTYLGHTRESHDAVVSSPTAFSRGASTQAIRTAPQHRAHESDNHPRTQEPLCGGGYRAKLISPLRITDRSKSHDNASYAIPHGEQITNDPCNEYRIAITKRSDHRSTAGWIAEASADRNLPLHIGHVLATFLDLAATM